MNNEKLKERWKDLKSEIYLQRIFQCFANGGTISEYLSPFGRYEGRIDFRGFTITPEQRTCCTKILKCCFKRVDFSQAFFGDAWTESCLFDDVIFVGADMRGYRDLGNQYFNCSFVKTDFSGAGIGHRGSHYNRCVFKNVKFRRTGFVRPEFDNCLFDNCKLKNVDFNASSFESCTFIGKLQGACFSNGYFLGEQLNKDFGDPRENRMLNVSFAKAELRTVDFRNNCDLSTVIMPESGEYRRYDNYAKRLKILHDHLDEFPENIKNEIKDLFIDIQLGTAINLNQDTDILNCEEIRQKYGEDNGQRMINILDTAI